MKEIYKSYSQLEKGCKHILKIIIEKENMLYSFREIKGLHCLIFYEFNIYSSIQRDSCGDLINDILWLQLEWDS